MRPWVRSKKSSALAERGLEARMTSKRLEKLQSASIHEIDRRHKLSCSNTLRISRPAWRVPGSARIPKARYDHWAAAVRTQLCRTRPALGGIRVHFVGHMTSRAFEAVSR